MRRLAISVLMIAAAVAVMPAAAGAATSFTGSYTATATELKITLNNTGTTGIDWWAFRIEGGDGHTGPTNMTSSHPGVFVPLGDYSFDFFPDGGSSRRLLAVPVGTEVLITIGMRSTFDKLFMAAAEKDPNEGGVLSQDQEIPKGCPPNCPNGPPASDPDPTPTPEPEEDPEELGDGECISRSFALPSFLSNHPCPVPEPTPPAGPCECADLKLTTRKHKIVGGSPFELGFFIDWELACKGKTGKRCAGKFEIVPPPQPRLNQGIKLRLATPGKTTVQCKRANSLVCKGKKGTTFVKLAISKHKNAFKQQRKQTLRHLLGNNPDNNDRPQVFVFTFRRTCDGEPLSSTFTQIRLDSKAKLDKEASDLNGNGTRDGQEKKKP